MDGVNIPISGDASKAEAAFEKMKAKVNSLTDTIEKMRQKSNKASEGMIKDFKGVSTSIEQADKNLAKFHLGHLKLNYAQMQLKNGNAFPKMTSDIKQAENATSALLSKTISFAGAIGLASRGMSMYLQHAREMRELSDNLSTASGNASGRAMVGGNISADKTGLVTGKIQSMADIASTSIEKSGKFTEKLTSGGVAPENFSKWKSAYKAITSTKSDDAGGLAESIMTMLTKEGINPAEATEQDIERNVSLLSKAFGLESSHGYNALSGSSDKLSNLDNFALISLMKERTSGNIRVATSKVKGATEKGVTSSTFKELKITKEQLEKRKSELSSGGSEYLAESFKLAESTPEAKSDRATTRDTIMFGQNVGPTEEQRKSYNRQFNANKGQSSLLGWAFSAGMSQEEAFELEDRLRALKPSDKSLSQIWEDLTSPVASKEREDFVQSQWRNEQKAVIDAVSSQNRIREKNTASKKIIQNDSK